MNVPLVRVWLARTPATMDAGCLAGLPESEQQRAAGIRHPDALRAFIASRQLLCRALAELEGKDPDDPALAHGRRFTRIHGKLALDSPARDWRISLSHGGERAACIITEGLPCGVDLENADRELPWAAIARRYFHPRELQDLEALPPSERRNAFLRLWTAKEAVVKAWSTGLANHMHRLDFDHRTLTLRDWPMAYAGERTRLRHWRQDGLLLTAAVESPTPPDWRLEIRSLGQPG